MDEPVIVLDGTLHLARPDDRWGKVIELRGDRLAVLRQLDQRLPRWTHEVSQNQQLVPVGGE